MMNKKLSALLLSAALMAGAGLSANAATTSSQTLSATLASFAIITPDPTAVLASSIDPSTGALSNAMTSKFDVTLNAPQTLYVSASANSSTVAQNAFFKNSGNTYVVLTQTTAQPTVAAITDAKAATPVAANNANVIAYQVTGVTLTGATTAPPTYNTTTNQYEIAGQPGITVATTTISTTVVPATFSYADSSGIYQATVTLSTSAT